MQALYARVHATEREITRFDRYAEYCVCNYYLASLSVSLSLSLRHARPEEYIDLCMLRICGDTHDFPEVCALSLALPRSLVFSLSRCNTLSAAQSP
jgi:hypothetical protein